MTELPISQKEYLKKYLAMGKTPGSKKKKKLKTTKRVKIIDDDETTFNQNVDIPITGEDIICINDNEDAPQIVAIIDERPPSLRLDAKTNNPLWQPIGTLNPNSETEQKQTMKGFKIQAKTNDKAFLTVSRSPPRRKKETKTLSDVAIKEEPQESEAKNYDNSPAGTTKDDKSPPRKTRFSDLSPKRKRDDNSPPRRSRFDSSSPRRKTNEDSFPPRKSRFQDLSPRRKRNASQDNSPPRKPRFQASSPQRNRSLNGDSSPRRKRNYHSLRGKQYYDSSPPRKRRFKSASPHRKYPENRNREPKNNFYDDDRGKSSRDYYERDRNKNDRRRGYSPSRRDNRNKMTQYDSKEKPDRAGKLEKTLDGKTAGLQNARELITETQNHKTREDTLFNSLSTDISGKNAGTVHRDRKTGHIRNIEEEEERQRKKKEEEEKNKEKYERWGRGVAQMASREERLKEQLHEMSKPLARYADDEDLEKFLKEKERDGDPMLAYLRKKKRKEAADRGEEIKPAFLGEFMPNRYGVRPGHRWDGVDRSNGYEKKWFEVQNQKRAQEEDVYKWSTEDM